MGVLHGGMASPFSPVMLLFSATGSLLSRKEAPDSSRKRKEVDEIEEDEETAILHVEEQDAPTHTVGPQSSLSALAYLQRCVPGPVLIVVSGQSLLTLLPTLP